MPCLSEAEKSRLLAVGTTVRVCSAGQAFLPLVSSSSMVVLVLSEDSCQREEGDGEEGLAMTGGAGSAWQPGCLVIRWALWLPRLCGPDALDKPCQTLQPEGTQLSRWLRQDSYEAVPARRSLASRGVGG